MAGLGVLLLAMMLMVMLVRVFMPFGQQIEGASVAQFSLPFRQRLLYQRSSIYLIGVVMLLGGLGGWLSGLMQTVAALAALMIVNIPIRYTLTSIGIGMNSVVFRHWDEFTGLDTSGRTLRLRAKAGMRDYVVRVSPSQRAEMIAALESGLAGGVVRATKGIGGGKAKRRQPAPSLETL